MKKILSIVFLVIPLLFLTYACGEETQATEAPRMEQIAPAVGNAVEKAKTAVENATSKAVEAVKATEESVVEAVKATEKSVVEAVSGAQATEKPAVEPAEAVKATEKPAVEPAEAVKATEKPVVEPLETEVVTEEVAVAPVVMAASHEEGAKLFKKNCAACHAGGGNLVAAGKTLKKEALEKYDMYSKEKIVYQVTNGKNAMPAFGKRLSPEQIESLAEYVLAQADAGW